MAAVEPASELPRREFARRPPCGRSACQAGAQPGEKTAKRIPVHVTRRTSDVRHAAWLRSAHHGFGGAVPEAPGAVIASTQAVGMNVVIDDQVGKVLAPGASVDQAPVHVLVFTRK